MKNKNMRSRLGLAPEDGASPKHPIIILIIIEGVATSNFTTVHVTDR
jgi:hypothetical protein